MLVPHRKWHLLQLPEHVLPEIKKVKMSSYLPSSDIASQMSKILTDRKVRKESAKQGHVVVMK